MQAKVPRLKLSPMEPYSFYRLRKWKVLENYVFYVECIDRRCFIPRGFVFDGATVPRIFQWLYSPVGILLIPSLFHDFAYEYGYLLIKTDDGEPEEYGHELDRADFDKIFYNITVQMYDQRIYAWIAYIFTRFFGFASYKGTRYRGPRHYKEVKDG